ncbi:hypothetical protein NDU88_005214 [Pleurodeles waltl]|uniref:Secreted protein n=1 Tax=Pleurodeles waltl TaxID=8319 RepID=A0AAV7UL92_PLEWA|nr:hypothetical protein NDU88_005214 [Pleurodeles waltl]
MGHPPTGSPVWLLAHVLLLCRCSERPAPWALTEPPKSCRAGSSFESGAPSAAPRSLRPPIYGRKPTPPACPGDQPKGLNSRYGGATPSFGPSGAAGVTLPLRCLAAPAG